MPATLTFQTELFPIAGIFRISRGAKTEAAVIACTLQSGSHAGRGECVPYARYGESLESVTEAIESFRPHLRNGAGRAELQELMPAGAARNALDCAFWDLEAKQSGVPVAKLLAAKAGPLVTAFTISLGSAEEMAAAAAAAAQRPLLKIKVGSAGDLEKIEAVVKAAPNSRLILDANEGWTDQDVEANLAAAKRLGIALVEQPLPKGRDAILGRISRPVPVCADESVHLAGDLGGLKGLYDAVNIKLDKSGGLTAALELRDAARAQGFQIMTGCMVGTSLAMAPAVLLAQGSEFCDLDGPLLLARDREPGLTYDGSLVYPPSPALWG